MGRRCSSTPLARFHSGTRYPESRLAAVDGRRIMKPNPDETVDEIAVMPQVVAYGSSRQRCARSGQGRLRTHSGRVAPLVLQSGGGGRSTEKRNSVTRSLSGSRTNTATLGRKNTSERAGKSASTWLETARYRPVQSICAASHSTRLDAPNRWDCRSR